MKTPRCRACRVQMIDDRDGGYECPECGHWEASDARDIRSGPAPDVALLKKESSAAEHFKKMRAAVDAAPDIKPNP